MIEFVSSELRAEVIREGQTGQVQALRVPVRRQLALRRHAPVRIIVISHWKGEPAEGQLLTTVFRWPSGAENRQEEPLTTGVNGAVHIVAPSVNMFGAWQISLRLDGKEVATHTLEVNRTGLQSN